MEEDNYVINYYKLDNNAVCKNTFVESKKISCTKDISPLFYLKNKDSIVMISALYNGVINFNITGDDILIDYENGIERRGVMYHNCKDKGFVISKVIDDFVKIDDRNKFFYKWSIDEENNYKRVRI